MTGTPVIYHIDVSTNVISEYLTNVDGTMWVTDVCVTYAPADIYITDYASHSVSGNQVQKHEKVRLFTKNVWWCGLVASYGTVHDCRHN